MSKWEVHKNRALGYWIAFPDGNIWIKGARSFPTWREAMAYADHMSRTIAVELPTTVDWGNGDESPFDLSVIAVAEGVIVQQFDETVLITQDELKPVALALLARHYQLEKNND